MRSLSQKKTAFALLLTFTVKMTYPFFLSKGESILILK